jgi:hypothetical protein
MKKLFFLLVVSVLIGINAYAATFRIGYPGTSVAGVDYAYNNISAAMTAASAGDTLQLYQQYWAGSPSITVTKPLKFIGFGYFLNVNTGLQSIAYADVNRIQFAFNSGASGTIVQGVYCYTSTINTSGITFNRCRFSTTGGAELVLANTSALSNITVSGCFFDNANYACIQESGAAFVTNMAIVNSVFVGNSGVYGQPIINLGHSTGLFANNVVRDLYTGTYAPYAPSLYSFIVKNSIFSTTNPPLVQSNVFQYNLFSNSNSTLITGVGNQYSVNMANVFVGWASNFTDDSQVLLKTGSPAIYAGLKNDSTATDCGVFGGEPGEVYKLSGIPPLPAIYQLSAPGQAATTNPYNITVSIRGNN